METSSQRLNKPKQRAFAAELCKVASLAVIQTVRNAISFLRLVQPVEVPHAEQGENDSTQEVRTGRSRILPCATYPDVNKPMIVPCPTKKRGAFK